MCGIVGLLVRDQGLEQDLGRHFTTMLEEMTARGPDSAGLAIYDRGVPAQALRWSLRSDAPTIDWSSVQAAVDTATGATSSIEEIGNIAFLVTSAGEEVVSQALLGTADHQLTIVGVGKAIRLIKDVGLPRDICERYRVPQMSGYLALGHTRMATESANTTDGAHPFSPANDLALVHNGSFSNHATIRRTLVDAGVTCVTDNDTEVAAQFIGYRMTQGDDLEEAMRHVLKEFDGFFTLVVSTDHQFSVVRDAFACKPMVIAERPEYIAVASEYHALASLPDIEGARIFEPQPEEIHTWTV